MKPNTVWKTEENFESEGTTTLPEDKMSVTSQPTTSAEDLFDPARLRLSQDFADGMGVRKELITVPVRKPDRQSFIRVHPDASYRLTAAILEFKEDREIFLIDPGIASELPGEISARSLLTAVNRQGVVFLWPARLPNPDGRRDEWSKSALEAAEIATRHWVRVVPNMSLGAYEVFQATGKLPEPDWPDIRYSKLLEIAFRDRYICTHDHPALRKLRGQV
jgi:hypothetical protein